MRHRSRELLAGQRTAALNALRGHGGFEMTIDAGLKPEGAPERSPIAGAGARSGVDAGPKRYSVQRKMAVVARLLRGEPLDRMFPPSVARSSRVYGWKSIGWGRFERLICSH